MNTVELDAFAARLKHLESGLRALSLPALVALGAYATEMLRPNFETLYPAHSVVSETLALATQYQGQPDPTLRAAALQATRAALRAVFKTKNHPAAWAALSLAKLLVVAADGDTQGEREEVELWTYNTCVTVAEQSAYDCLKGTTGLMDASDVDSYLDEFGTWIFYAALEQQEIAGA
jgi:hypothetical protein